MTNIDAIQHKLNILQQENSLLKKQLSYQTERSAILQKQLDKALEACNRMFELSMRNQR